MKIIRNSHHRRIKRELIALLVFAFIASLSIFFVGVLIVIFMVDKGWIN